MFKLTVHSAGMNCNAKSRASPLLRIKSATNAFQLLRWIVMRCKTHMEIGMTLATLFIHESIGFYYVRTFQTVYSLISVRQSKRRKWLLLRVHKDHNMLRKATDRASLFNSFSFVIGVSLADIVIYRACVAWTLRIHWNKLTENSHQDCVSVAAKTGNWRHRGADALTTFFLALLWLACFKYVESVGNDFKPIVGNVVEVPLYLQIGYSANRS